jgi:hypothetical protein
MEKGKFLPTRRGFSSTAFTKVTMGFVRENSSSLKKVWKKNGAVSVFKDRTAQWNYTGIYSGTFSKRHS